VQFILESRAFLLELADYRLHQCFWHEAILLLADWTQDGSCVRFWSTSHVPY
jgi:hypothetical protein